MVFYFMHRMKRKITWLLAKIGLILLKGSLYVKRGFIFLGKFLEGPAIAVGRALFNIGLFFYKGYFLAKQAFLRIFLPSKNILDLVTNKYIVHAAIVVIAVATATQSVYAYTSALGDYGKKSILFRLTQPIEEEEVGGVPINSDIEETEDSAGPAVAPSEEPDAGSYGDIGFVGGDITPGDGLGVSARAGIEYYVVKKGDTIGLLAEEFGISVNTILWANKLSANSVIRPGDKLTILPVTGVMHTVKKGDTVASIASKYKGDKDKVVEFNKLANANDISVGQVLIVPDGKIVYVAPPAPVVSDSGYVAGKVYTSAGTLFWPVPSRRITQYFNWRHPGLDIGLPTGNAIFAAESGTVIYSGWGKGYGYEVLIDHGNGMKTRYAHASRLIVKAGDHVERGQTVALSGNTGWSTGPHLHFEVYVGNVRKNPLLYIK